MKKVFGFTIIELLVSISIFLIITSMVIVNFRSGQYRDELMGSAQFLQSTLREMQTMAFSGSKVICPGYVPSEAGEMTPAGYGLNINSSGIITAFADCDPQDIAISPDFKYGLEDVNLKTISLYNNVTINSITPSSVTDILFTSSSEIVKTNGSPGLGVITIELKHNKTNQITTVKIVELTGQVFIQ